jgi:hypothetical protein
MRRSRASCYAIAASTVTGAHAAAVEAASAHSAAVKSSTSKATTAKATTATSEGVVGNEAGANQNERCHGSEKTAKHGVPPLFGGAVHCRSGALEDRHPARAFLRFAAF